MVTPRMAAFDAATMVKSRPVKPSSTSLEAPDQHDSFEVHLKVLNSCDLDSHADERLPQIPDLCD